MGGQHGGCWWAGTKTWATIMITCSCRLVSQYPTVHMVVPNIMHMMELKSYLNLGFATIHFVLYIFAAFAENFDFKALEYFSYPDMHQINWLIPFQEWLWPQRNLPFSLSCTWNEINLIPSTCVQDKLHFKFLIHYLFLIQFLICYDAFWFHISLQYVCLVYYALFAFL